MVRTTPDEQVRNKFHVPGGVVEEVLDAVEGRTAKLLMEDATQ